MFLTTIPRRAPIDIAARTLHQIPRMTVEVERRFAPTTTSLKLLRSNTGNPPFTKHVYIGKSMLHDTYLDKDSIFMPQGIYIRLRNSQWEAKVTSQTKDSGTVQQCTEHTNESQIRRLAWDTLHRAGSLPPQGVPYGSVLEELRPAARIVACRDEWKVDGFNVVVDETEWGYQVGEVELMGTASEKDMEEVMERMSEQLLAFIREHKDVFPGGEDGVMGKLSSYFRWKEAKEG